MPLPVLGQYQWIWLHSFRCAYIQLVQLVPLLILLHYRFLQGQWIKKKKSTLKDICQKTEKTLVSSHGTRQTNVNPFFYMATTRQAFRRLGILYIEIAYTSPCLAKQGEFSNTLKHTQKFRLSPPFSCGLRYRRFCLMVGQNVSRCST